MMSFSPDVVFKRSTLNSAFHQEGANMLASIHQRYHDGIWLDTIFWWCSFWASSVERGWISIFWLGFLNQRGSRRPCWNKPFWTSQTQTKPSFCWTCWPCCVSSSSSSWWLLLYQLPGVRDAFGTPIYNRGARCIWCVHKQRQRRVAVPQHVVKIVSWFLVGRFGSSNTSPIKKNKWNRPDIKLYQIHPNPQILAHIHLYIRRFFQFHCGDTARELEEPENHWTVVLWRAAPWRDLEIRAGNIYVLYIYIYLYKVIYICVLNKLQS